MKVLTIYHYPQCGTCRNAIKWLEGKESDLNKVHIVDNPPSKEELRNMWMNSGLDLKKFFNTSGELYKTMNMKDKLPQLSEEEQLELLSQHGKLIKRPLVSDGSKATVGFKEQDFEKVWG